MKINKSNIVNIKNVYIHDDVLNSLKFDRTNKELILKFQKYAIDQEYILRFENVIGFEMTACDFWGSSECVFGFAHLETGEQTLIPKLKERWQKQNQLMEDIKFENFLEIILTFTSGDSLVVACEEFERC